MTPSNALTLQTQINSLGERMDKGFDEIKEMLRNFDGRVRNVETSAAGHQPVMDSRIDAAWRKLDDHDNQLKIVEAQIAKLMAAYGVMVFVGSAIGLSVLALIWSLITGQAQVVIR